MGTILHDYVTDAIELILSRYEDGYFEVELFDRLADGRVHLIRTDDSEEAQYLYGQLLQELEA